MVEVVLVVVDVLVEVVLVVVEVLVDVGFEVEVEVVALVEVVVRGSVVEVDVIAVVGAFGDSGRVASVRPFEGVVSSGARDCTAALHALVNTITASPHVRWSNTTADGSAATAQSDTRKPRIHTVEPTSATTVLSMRGVIGVDGSAVVQVGTVLVAIVMAAFGVGLAWCVLVLAAAPAVSVVAAELGVTTAPPGTVAARRQESRP